MPFDNDKLQSGASLIIVKVGTDNVNASQIQAQIDWSADDYKWPSNVTYLGFGAQACDLLRIAVSKSTYMYGNPN
jgi:hypothetical protein